MSDKHHLSSIIHHPSSGWVLLDKPSGMTSRKAGAIVARAIGAKTFGHIGTLDPMASGLLPIALGEATKMIPFLEVVGRRAQSECESLDFRVESLDRNKTEQSSKNLDNNQGLTYLNSKISTLNSSSPSLFAIRPSTFVKEYLFSVVWGIQTDTLDITGKIVNRAESIEHRLNQSPVPSPQYLKSACADLTGEIMQTPPAYSAVHVDGRRAYELARAGKTPDIPARPVVIYELEVVDESVECRVESVDKFKSSQNSEINNNYSCRDDLHSTLSTLHSSIFRVVCSPGTYVRVLAQQIAEQINKQSPIPNPQSLCTVNMIRRTRTSGFHIKNAVSLDFPENLCNYLKPVDFGLDDIPVLNLDNDDAKLFQNGGFLPAFGAGDSGLVRVYHNDKFIGIGNLENNILKPKRVIGI